MKFTVVVDTDTSKDSATAEDIRTELLWLLKSTRRDWRFKVWPPTETEVPS